MTIGSIPHYPAPDGSVYTAVQKPGQDEQYHHLHDKAESRGSAIYGLASASGGPPPKSASPYEDVNGQTASTGRGDYEPVDFPARPVSAHAQQDKAVADFEVSPVVQAWVNPNDGRRGVHLEQFTKDLIKTFCTAYPAGPARILAPAFSYGAGKACHLAAGLANGTRHRDMFRSLSADAAEANRTSGVDKAAAQMSVLNQALKNAFVDLPEAMQAKWLKRATTKNVAECSAKLRLDEYGMSNPGYATLSALLSVANEVRRQSLPS
ncbi:hypothetical protein CDN99_17290 [Roseateles aquatilis]|uniref:Uncharacterized protein n=1 Tax=Roseateles aquatilis TaxID=431061 RepID=A0A246J7R1_9BURK|nr:hypothetical protein [Roseateles aquatilis]OWQ88597.1 hypothetical protein CDN99_17290 [Roseateles aquatilis]